MDLGIHHLAAPERAEALRAALVQRLGERVRRTYVSEAGGAIAAHAGLGLACVVVHRCPEAAPEA